MQQQSGIKNPSTDLASLGLTQPTIYWNLPAAELIERALILGECKLTDTGAVTVDTGKFTGRSPEDRFIVKDHKTADSVDWGKVNIPFDPQKFDLLYDKVLAYLNQQPEVFVQEAYACADPQYRLSLRLIAEKPWEALFANNMFIRLQQNELHTFTADWQILAAPGFLANPAEDGTRQNNFAILNFTRQTIIIGGTGYTGEIKKGIFSVLNFLLPHEHGVLSMHCSANVGKNGDTALFFGLSGTGKTTLSADPDRALIGDDEHGWSENTVFNFEGGCYAKTIDLSAEREPQIYEAIKHGALLENVRFYPNTRTVDYTDKSVTENTRVSYPINFIDNIMDNSMGNVPQNIFFLTCDAFGVLPPITRLTAEQAMYHFISGYTAKVAGTEAGVIEPQSTFSACFGRVFLPLHPATYAQMLGNKLKNSNISVWLINTGWSGGAYGVGSRMKLRYTRAMITAALNNQLTHVHYEVDPIFGFNMPTSCPNVPTEILNPRNTWADKNAYDKQAEKLAGLFTHNFKQFADKASHEILSAAPKIAALT